MPACNNCGNIQLVPFVNAKCLTTSVPLSVAKCSKCGLVLLHPRPEKSLGLEYFEKAYSNAHEFRDHPYYRDEAQITLRNKNRLRITDGLQLRTRRLLDFGAGQGHFVRAAVDGNFDATGVEQSAAGVNAAWEKLGVKLFSSLNEVQQRPFEVITLWDVVEHLEDPKNLLRELSDRYLVKNGYLIIETSNIDSVDFYLLGKKWGYWNVDHLFYYSRRTLVELMTGLGFTECHPRKETTTVKRLPLIKKIPALLKPHHLLYAIRKRLIQKNRSDLSRNSLMTLVFQKA